jgi:hypothetical protein
MISNKAKLIKLFSNRVITDNEVNYNLAKKDINFHDFKSISIASEKLVESIDPIKEIRNLVNQNPKDVMKMRFLGLNKYKTSLFLNRELQQELQFEGGLTNSKINNQILNDNFIYNEDKSNNLFLHKKIHNYYVLVHFKYLKPNKDKKKILDFKTNLIKDQYNRFGITTGMLHKLTGADDNPDYLKAKNEDLIEMGTKDDEDYPKDLTPFYFNINLINKNSECLQFRCFSEETKVSYFLKILDFYRKC